MMMRTLSIKFTSFQQLSTASSMVSCSKVLLSAMASVSYNSN